MKISILTLFPEMFEGPFHHSIIKHAMLKKILTLAYINIRDFGIGKHKIVDDKPYGGGAGMLLRVDVLAKAIAKAKCNAYERSKTCKEKVILLDPQGTVFDQKVAHKLAKINHLILICSHYEGVDQRVRNLVDEEISIGDYVLTGGEIPAMVITDAVIRLLPGVLGKETSNKLESFQKFPVALQHGEKLTSSTLLEYPQYTRPVVFEGENVPDILLSGNHGKIALWRKEEALKNTKKKRPDLLKTRK